MMCETHSARCARADTDMRPPRGRLYARTNAMFHKLVIIIHILLIFNYVVHKNGRNTSKTRLQCRVTDAAREVVCVVWAAATAGRATELCQHIRSIIHFSSTSLDQI